MRLRFGRRGLAVTAAAVVLALLTGCAADRTVDVDVPPQVEGPLPAETVQQLEAAVSSAMSAAGASGAIVGVWAPWSGSWVTGMGTQAPGDAAPATTDMMFRAATVTRAMTCDVLFQVVDRGDVSMDAVVSELVSGFPSLDNLTLGHLCDGTSGLGSYAPRLQGQWQTNPARQWNPRELAAYGVAAAHEAPGTVYRDSDAAYLLLGLALERATGERMQNLITEYVTGPLALRATGLPGPAAAPPSTSEPVLDGHWSTPDGEGVFNCTDPLDITTISSSVGGANAGVVTNITDLGRYAQALATGALLPPDSGRFDAPVPVGNDAPGWLTYAGGAYQAGGLIGQYGSIPGYLTAAFAHPETGMTVAVVLNNSGGNPALAGWLAWELAAIASKAPPAAGQTLPEAGLPWTPEQYHDAIAANAICAPPQ